MTRPWRLESRYRSRLGGWRCWTTRATREAAVRCGSDLVAAYLHREFRLVNRDTGEIIPLPLEVPRAD